MDNYIDKDLLQQKRMLIEILNITAKQYDDMYKALFKENSNLAKVVENNDEIINKLHDKFINTSLWKIAKQQMVAKDLRQVVTFIIIVHELERIADYAAHLCHYYIKYKPSNKLIEFNLKEPVEDLIKMIKHVQTIITKGNLSLAYQIPSFENIINDKFKENTRNLIKKMKNVKTEEDAKLINVTLQQLKYIERAGDHLVNICELLIYIKEGQFFDLAEEVQV